MLERCPTKRAIYVARQQKRGRDITCSSASASRGIWVGLRKVACSRLLDDGQQNAIPFAQCHLICYSMVCSIRAFSMLIQCYAVCVLAGKPNTTSASWLSQWSRRWLRAERQTALKRRKWNEVASWQSQTSLRRRSIYHRVCDTSHALAPATTIIRKYDQCNF